MTQFSLPPQAPPASRRLPLGPLSALSFGAFLTIMTEALPAGLLPQMSAGLAVTESLVGQLVTVYALGSMLAAIPLVLLTQTMNRRGLLMLAVAGFCLANSATALSASFSITIVARFIAGISAGLLWALVAGYAARLVPPEKKGRAIAIAMVGTPIALSLGVPAGTFAGQVVGWRWVFGAMSLGALLLLVWVRCGVPDFSGRATGRSYRLLEVARMPGIVPILVTLLGFVLAHNILYTYIAPSLERQGLRARIDLALLVFGLAALVGIWSTGILIDRRLRFLVLTSIVGFAVAVTPFFWTQAPAPLIFGAVTLWGFAFGGTATQYQTALSNAAGDATDVAQSMLVTAWNLAIASGGAVGGLLLAAFGPASFPPVVVGLLALAFLVATAARRYGFPIQKETSRV